MVLVKSGRVLRAMGLGWAAVASLTVAACKLDFDPQRRANLDAGEGSSDSGAAHDGDGDGAPEHDAGVDVTSDAAREPADSASEADASVDPDGSADAAAPLACTAEQSLRCGQAFPCLASAAGYTCRGQFPDWPVVTRASPLAGFVIDAANNRVLDETSGLEWVRSTESAAGTYAEAAAFCAALGADEHVPTVAEFSSLLNTPLVPTVDPEVFPDGAGLPYWTSTPVRPQPDGGGAPWMFGLGQVNGFLDIVPYAPVETLRVACVRVAEPRFVASPEARLVEKPDYVFDQNTGLYWLRAGLEADVPYADAAAWCEEKEVGGRRWRVPTTAELLSLADPTRDYMTASPEVYQGWVRDVHWTSDVAVGAQSSHYALNFGWYDERFDVRVLDLGGTSPDVCCPVRCVSTP